MREVRLKIIIFQSTLDDKNAELKGPKVSRKIHDRIRYSDFMLLLESFVYLRCQPCCFSLV